MRWCFMRRLISKLQKKKRKIALTAKFVFEVISNDDIEAKEDIKLFRNWMANEFSKWNDSILQHFLYQNNLSQEKQNPKYILSVNMDKVISDDSSAKDERLWFNEQLNKDNLMERKVK